MEILQRETGWLGVPVAGSEQGLSLLARVDSIPSGWNEQVRLNRLRGGLRPLVAPPGVEQLFGDNHRLVGRMKTQPSEELFDRGVLRGIWLAVQSQLAEDAICAWPASLSTLYSTGPLPDEVHFHVVPCAEPESGYIDLDITVYDNEGHARLAFRDFSLRIGEPPHNIHLAEEEAA